MERILLVTMGFGVGHNATAQTLKQELTKLPVDKVVIVDLLRLIPHRFHPLLQTGYHGMLRKFPSFYHYLYDLTHQNRVVRFVSSEFIEKIGWTLHRRLHLIYQEVKPTKIVITHPFALLLCPTEWSDIPTVGVVTDYEIHPLWFARVPNVLCVPQKLLNVSQLEKMAWRTGVKVVETGIPVAKEFYHPVERQSLLRKFDLDERPIVLIMGGGAGIGPLEQIVQEIKHLTNLQFIVLTGNNKSLYQRLQGKTENHIKVLSFCEEMANLMSIADLLVTKPGGVTVSEAIAKNLPMFLFEAYPGQEEANQQYLLHHRLAMITRPSTINLQLEKYFHPQYKRERFTRRFPSLQTPYAIDDILTEVAQSKVPMFQLI